MKIERPRFFSKLKKFYHIDMSHEELFESYRDAYLDVARIDEEMMQFIGLLKERYKIEVFTNTVDLHYQLNDDREFWWNFHHVDASCHIGIAKPDVRAYVHIIGDLKVYPTECFYVDDTGENMMIAKKLGMHAEVFESKNNFLNTAMKMKIV